MRFPTPLIYLFASVLPAIIAATLKDLQAAIIRTNIAGDNISARVRSFTTPGFGSLTTGLSIITDTFTLVPAITNAATVAESLSPCPAAESDGPIFVSIFKSYVYSATNGLDITKNQSRSIGDVGFGFPPVVKITVHFLKVTSGSLGNSIQKCAPTSVHGEMDILRQQMDNKFDGVIGGF